MIKAPAFWWDATPVLAARLLAPFGTIYGAVTARRMARPGTRVGVPVICVGNLTVGGSGKTPVAMHVARRLQTLGERPVFLTRGYGARVNGPVMLGPNHSAADVGDEPLLLARVARTIVAPDRLAGAALAREAGASVIIMDDGLQNPSLHKDLRLAVIEGGTGFGNGLVCPAGPLRASVARQRSHVDAAIVIGDGKAGLQAAASLGDLPVLIGHLTPRADIAARLAGQSVIAMAGIGLPDKFARTLAACGARVVGTHFVADHAPYGSQELMTLGAHAAAIGALVATTEKDMARLGSRVPPDLAERLVVVPVTLTIADGDADLDALLGGVVGKEPRRPPDTGNISA
jgi:tetraacyldisaccharide 4'-kinase